MTPTPSIEESTFLNRVRMATYGILLLVLVIHLLQQFQSVLQPLFVLLFLVFLMHPIHRWLVQRGIPSMLSYGVIVFFVALAGIGMASLLYDSLSQLSQKVPVYEARLESMIRDVANRLPIDKDKTKEGFLRERITSEQLLAEYRMALGRFGDFSSWAALTFVYLLFLIAEKVGFPHRLELAFGAQHGDRVMSVLESISQAIGNYIAVKTLVSALAGFLSYLVLAFFDIDFAATWGILIFLFNYIPYLGSLIAVSVPILLSFLQFDDIWRGIVITTSLIGIQQLIGAFIEPRMTGQRLDVSPLLILLSLAFWGVVWGIIGMILAVPLLVIAKIILDNINETKPIATLISNK